MSDMSPNVRQEAMLKAKLEEWFKTEKFLHQMMLVGISRLPGNYFEVKVQMLVGPIEKPIAPAGALPVRNNGSFTLRLELDLHSQNHTSDFTGTNSGLYIHEYIRCLGFIPQMMDFILTNLDLNEIQLKKP